MLVLYCWVLWNKKYISRNVLFVHWWLLEIRLGKVGPIYVKVWLEVGKVFKRGWPNNICQPWIARSRAATHVPFANLIDHSRAYHGPTIFGSQGRVICSQYWNDCAQFCKNTHYLQLVPIPCLDDVMHLVEQICFKRAKLLTWVLILDMAECFVWKS